MLIDQIMSCRRNVASISPMRETILDDESISMEAGTKYTGIMKQNESLTYVAEGNELVYHHK